MKLWNFHHCQKNAAEARTFKNTIYSMICKLAKTDEGPVFAWISECEKPNASVNDSLPYPLLDRVLGSKLLELSKSTRFSMLFQSLQESSQKIGRQPRGRLLLHTVFEKYKMEKDRGVALTQHHLLSLRVTGNDIKALEEFRTKFDYIYQALDTGERPTDSAMRSFDVWAVEESSKNGADNWQIPKCFIIFVKENSSMALWKDGWGYRDPPVGRKLLSQLTRIFRRWEQK